MDSSKGKLIIIGSGFSGTLFLLKALQKKTFKEIHIFEKTKTFATGLAYSCQNQRWKLNVPASRMSLYSEDPGHFAKAMGIQEQEQFVSRQAFGNYLQKELARALSELSPEQKVFWVDEEVTDIFKKNDGTYEIKTETGRESDGHFLVLAVGNPQPSWPEPLNGIKKFSPRWIHNSWDERALLSIPTKSRILLLGSGLTMVDCFLLLKDRGHSLVALSRRGLRPNSHKPVTLKSGRVKDLHISTKTSPRGLLKFLRTEINNYTDWQDLFDQLRPYVQEIWWNWNARERRQFLRHVRPYWDVHRHRIAPEIFQELSQALNEGSLRFMKGRIVNYEQNENFLQLGIRFRGEDSIQTEVFDYVINCTGPDETYRNHSLMQKSFSSGLLRPGFQNLGVDCDERGFARGADGGAYKNFVCLGPLLKGGLWEITAVPEIRKQIDSLLATL